MLYSKFFLASVLGALTLSGAMSRSLSKDEKKVNTSRAKCQVVALGYSEVNRDKAIATAVADASAFICDDKADARSSHDIAKATAEAFALAVASASAECELVGDAKVQVNAHASAEAAANVWLEAYASAWAGSGSCDRCSAYADSWGYVYKDVFLKAVAEASVKLDAYTKPGSGPLVLKVYDFKVELEKAVAIAFAEALAYAEDYHNKEGCFAWVTAGGCIYTEKNPDATYPNCDGDNIGEFECTAVAASSGKIREIDAIAEASASAAAWTCGDSVAIADLEVTAKALAKATATAVSFAYAGCEVENGWACAFADTEIEQTARAVATAYADLWAGAYRCDGDTTCSVGVDAVAKAVGDVLVKACTDAWAGVCVDGGFWAVADFEAKIVEGSLCAIAEASATAISAPPSTCIAGGIVYAGAHSCH